MMMEVRAMNGAGGNITSVRLCLSCGTSQGDFYDGEVLSTVKCLSYGHKNIRTIRLAEGRNRVSTTHNLLSSILF